MRWGGLEKTMTLRRAWYDLGWSMPLQNYAAYVVPSIYVVPSTNYYG